MPRTSRGHSANAAPSAPLEAERLAALAKALAHPARIHIVRLLLAKRSCIGCDIVDEIGLAQSTVSEHLRILKAAGIITGDIERPRVCYSLNAQALLPLADMLNELERQARGKRRRAICRPSGERGGHAAGS